MSGISCHVLDTARGRPAAGIPLTLERLADAAGDWQLLGRAVTGNDGRAADLEGGHARALGRHRITFELEAYFQSTGQPLFFPRVQVELMVSSPSERYHVPLLLSPFGYSTYRGS